MGEPKKFVNGYDQLEWEDYLTLVEKRHGKEAAALARKWGTPAAGEHANLLGRQRISARAKINRRRNFR